MMSFDDPIPMARFDGSALPPEQRVAAFARLAGGYDVALAPETDPATFHVDCRAWLIHDLALTSNTLDAVDIERTPAHIAADGRETYSFILLKHGSWTGELDCGAVNVGSGQVCVMDFAQVWRVRGTAQHNIMLIAPRPLIAGLAHGAPPLHGRLLDSMAGRLLAEHMLSLARFLPETRMRDAPLLRDTTVSLLSAAVAALRPISPQQAAEAEREKRATPRVRAFIDAHLTDPALNVALICRALGISRPALYRAFAAEEGVAGYIRRRRLEAAHALLADQVGQAGIAEVAERFCFSSHAHFTTAFRRRFHYTPRTARAPKMAPTQAPDVFANWRATLERLSSDQAG
jgi:AraC-like DNA-binding protein